ncbi:MAG TPA: hypothetical protein PLX80_12930 [Ignavibacteria bacterium]|nr:hypothetical protein [Ignavibacteria bacterium]
MNQTKLILTLKSFSRDEIKLFEKFIASPFFNNGRNYIPFFTELKKFYPSFESENLNAEFIYEKLYQGKKFNRQVMWNFVSQLEKLALEFLIHNSLKQNRSERFYLISDELLKRNLDKHLLKEIESMEKILSTAKLSIEYYKDKLLLEDSKAEYWYVLQGRQDLSFAGLVGSTEFLILKMIAELSVLVSDLQILKIMYNDGKETNAAIELVKSLNLNNLVTASEINENKYAKVYKFYYDKIMCALDENDETHFFEMKKFFDENYFLFDLNEQSNTIISLANYCAHKMRLGIDKYLRILFELNKFRLEKNIGIHSNGNLNKALFHQILRNALSLGETDWAENFVVNYTPKLKINHQKTMNALAMGFICYAKKDFTGSLDYLSKVEFIDIRDKLHVRILSAKAYYELNNTETLFYFIDSSNHFIKKNTLIGIETRDSYLKFFNYLKKLLICKDNYNKNKVMELNSDINTDQILRLRHKEWLLEKLSELK